MNLKIIFVLILIFILSLNSQSKKPVIIKGFDGKTYVKYPNKKAWVESDTIDTNYVDKSQIRVEYTNFDGETIDMTSKRPIFIPEKGKLVNFINVANDPSKDYYNLYFQLNENAKVMIQVYTTDDFRVSDIAWEEYKKGMNKVNIKKKFSKGSYVIYMTIDNEVFKHRVLFD